MGVVHLTEEYLKKDPPARDELARMENDIRGLVEGLEGRMRADIRDNPVFSGAAEFVGTAGTITTLAALDQDLSHYDPERINNFTLTRTAVERMYARLSALTIKERERILTLEKGREDLIIPGAAIVLSVMDRFGFDSMKVSDAGLLEGLVLSECGLGSSGV
jgi:exopolyphosphatase/guanosine-5'-triphosphate,3'-diphosphate pyrophosphatase